MTTPDTVTETILASRVAESLRMMFDGSIAQAANYQLRVPQAADGLVAVVPLIGTPNYILTLHANDDGAVALASAMFSCAKHLTNQSMIDDALCELANMVAGQVKSLMARHHQIGVPSLLANDAVLADAHGVTGAGVYIGDTSAEIAVVIAEYRPALTQVAMSAEPPAPSIIIAEDDDVTLAFLKAAVTGAGLRLVAEARDGLQAMEAIRQHRPDVVCLDINMPGLTGLQVLAKVRKALPETTVFMVSSFATAENVREALTLRADGIIVKPFVKARIISEIERALAQRQAASNRM